MKIRQLLRLLRPSKKQAAGRKLVIETLEERQLLTSTPLLTPFTENMSPTMEAAMESFHGEDLTGKDGPMVKVGFDLTYLYHEYQAHMASGSGSTFEPSNSSLQVFDDRVIVDVIAEADGASLQPFLVAMGMEVDATVGRVVAGDVAIDALDDLAAMEAVRFARPAYAPITNAVTSQGDAALQADTARTSFGVDGSGITVGVISTSYDTNTAALTSADDDIASDDLPDEGVTVIGLDPVADDEGRAMLQIVHDLAPGAALSFATAFPGEAAFAQNIRALAMAGADVIVDDIAVVAAPFFQDGMVAQAVDDVVSQGVPYFSAAFNYGTKSYQRPFNDSGIPGPDGGTLHDFDPDPAVVDESQRITIPANGEITISFQWDEPFASLGGAGSASDINIYLLDFAANVVMGINPNMNADPLEVIVYSNPLPIPVFADVFIEHVDGPAPDLMKYIGINIASIDEYNANTFNQFGNSNATSFGHPNATGASAIASSAYFLTPESGRTPPVVNNGSSLGGTPILFDTAGNPLAQPEIRQHPDVTGVDGVDNTFFPAPSLANPNPDFDGTGSPNFFGTSAAAPHIAAVAALMLEASGGPGSLTPSQIYQTLETTAIDITERANDFLATTTTPIGAGYDFFSGWGLVNAQAAVEAATAEIGNISGEKWFDRDGDGIRDAGEEGLAGWTIYLDLNSNGVLDAGEPSQVTATDGSYEFAGVQAGTYTVAEVLQTSWTQTFPAAGTYTVNVVADQTVTGIDFGNVRASSISGFKWFDRDGDGSDIGEEGLPGWQIYLDLNNNGRLDIDEPSQLTSANGRYQFSGLTPATYTVAEVLQSTWEQTFPDGGIHTVDLTDGQGEVGLNFGNLGPPGVSGFKYVDLDEDGVRDVGEPGLGGVYIYLDANEDGKPGGSERGTFSKANGFYLITDIEPGTYQVREVEPPGWRQTAPASGSYEITYQAGDALTGLDFGNVGQIDWGDAPAIYPTLAADDGANHVFSAGFQLGRGGPGVTRIDAEVDGQPSAGANLDDLTFLDDEDGVLGLATPLTPGTNHAITVIGSPAQDVVKGKFNGWIDFNADGDWDDPGEQVFYDLLIKSGENELTFWVPEDIAAGPTYARFRISTEWNLPYFGAAPDGEVEDYVVNIDNPAQPFGAGAVFLGEPVDDTLTGLNIVGPTELYEVVAGETGIMSVLASFDHDLGNIDIAVYDAGGRLLGQSGSVTDEERVDINSVYGERYFIKIFGSNPDVDLRVLNLVALDDKVVIVGNRSPVSVEMTALPNGDNGTSNAIELVVNDVDYLFNAPRDFFFLGGGDDDDVTINSNDSDDDITFREGSVKVINPSFTFDARYVPDIFVDAAGGEDAARFFNLTGPDTFTSSPEFSQRTNYTVNQRVDSADRVMSYAVEFEDTATVTGTEQDDRFVGREASSYLTSDTFFAYLNNYKKLTVDANGGEDTATVADSVGDDLAVANGNFSYIDAFTFRIDMRDFERVNFSSTTGNDAASFYGADSDDLMVGDQTRTYLRTDEHFFYAASFPTVIVDGRGGDDRAFFRGTIGEAETYVAREQNAFLRANDWSYYIRGKGFETNRGFGGTEDMAFLYDTIGAETYVARPESVYMFNTSIDMINYAAGFGKTKAFATAGTGDKADVFDGPGDDSLLAEDDLFFLMGLGYSNQGVGFDDVVADGTAGGTNIVVINGITYNLTLIGPWV